MTRDNEPAIEVEVLEVDGAAPPPPKDAAGALHRPTAADAAADDESRSGESWTNWQRWPGQARVLHPLWWPVLIVGGGILLVLFLTVGLCVAVLVVIYRIVRGVLRALFE